MISTFINTMIMYVYYLISAFVAFILLREIRKTEDAQEAVLYCIILMPFVLRVLRLK